MPPTKLKNFRLPLDLCDALEEDGRTQTAIVVKALRSEFDLSPEVTPEPVAPKPDLTDRVRELAKTLPPATAQRIAELEAAR